MKDYKIEMTINDVDFTVYYLYQAGTAPIIHRLPEDCEEGQEAECEIGGIYLDGWQVDLIDIASEEEIEDMENYIFENQDDAMEVNYEVRD